jgi:transposase InsO family protein
LILLIKSIQAFIRAELFIKPQNILQLYLHYYHNATVILAVLSCHSKTTKNVLPEKHELIRYIDYYNNRRIKAKLKGLPPALHRQQALPAA